MQTTILNQEAQSIKESKFIDWLLKRNNFDQVITVLSSSNVYRKLKEKYIKTNFHISL